MSKSLLTRNHKKLKESHSLFTFMALNLTEKDMTEADAFQYLKPYCIEVAQNPTAKSLQELQNALRLVERKVFREESMVNYVLFPLTMTIKRIKNSNEKILIKTIESISLLFSFSNVKSKQLFLEIFDICCVLLSSQKQSVGKKMVAEISEELKIKIVELISILLKNSSKAAALCLYTEQILPRLGHAISLLLVIIEFEKERELRLGAIKCLQLLFLKHQSNNQSETQLISDMNCSFIPGITLSLSRVLLDASNIGQNVLATAVEALKDVILLVMADARFSFLKKDVHSEDLLQRLKNFSVDKSKSQEAESHKEQDKRSIRVQRGKLWMEKTASKIDILIEKVLPRIAYHSSSKVRLSTISLAESLLKDCSTSMALSAPRLIEILAGMQHDEYDTLSQKAAEAIESSRHIFQKGGKSLHRMVEDKLYDKLLSLPRIMRSSSDDQKLVVLNILLGYFNLLGDKLADILTSISVLEKLIKSFIQALELDVSDVKIVEEKSHGSSEDMIEQKAYSANENDVTTHRFKNFKDRRIFKTIQMICCCMGKFADLNVIVDYLLEVFLSSPVHRKEATLFLNEVLRCCIEIETNGDTAYGERRPIEAVVNQITSTYLRDEFWFLPTSNVTNVCRSTKNYLEEQLTLLRAGESREQLGYWERGLPIEQINSNIQLICLMIKGISICSGLKNFGVSLIRVLYPILEKLGNENSMIAASALDALSVISRKCVGASKGTNPIADLISHNSDYLINSISMSFRHLTLLSSAPCVLSVMLSYSNRDILPIVSDVIQDVFRCLDLYQEEVAFSLMKVLKSLVSAVYTWYGSEFTNVESKQNIDQEWNNIVTPLDLGSFVSDYCRLKTEALGDVDEGTVEGGEEEDEDGATDPKPDANDEVKDVPAHFKVTLTTLEKCQHFLPSKDVRLKLLILDVIELSMQALKQQQKDLLPSVHKIWPSIVERIKDTDHVIVSRTFEVISKVVDCTGDFLGQRLKKDVFPFLFDYLEKHRNSSLLSSRMYQFSPTCKLQTRLLALVNSTIQRLGLSNEILWKAAVVSSCYLDCRQPLVLQIEATNLFNRLRDIDWSKVWIVLTSLYSPEEFTAPNSCFKAFHLKKGKRNEFTDNVMKILYNHNLCI